MPNSAAKRESVAFVLGKKKTLALAFIEIMKGSCLTDVWTFKAEKSRLFRKENASKFKGKKLEVSLRPERDGVKSCCPCGSFGLTNI